MSVLLFCPETEFDFNKKSLKPNKAAIIFGCIIFLLILSVSLVGFGRQYSRQDKLIIRSQKLVRLASNSHAIKTAQGNIKKAVFSPSPIPPEPSENKLTQVPIIMYHYTPVNFEDQLDILKTRGYEAITAAEFGRYLVGIGNIPTKPVVITYDDGFADQVKAFDILKRHNTKATFYFILGGSGSNYCIGLERSNLACGDAYLNYSSVKEMLDSGLIEIGAHTINHADLASLSEEQQWFEISESKNRLEQMYNIVVESFAYPYGRYNSTTIELVRKAGYSNAVTTRGGYEQSSFGRFELYRVQSAYALP